jgi:hypothetical protein
MGRLGVHFALTAQEVAKLRKLGSDEARLEYLHSALEERYLDGDQEFAAESDKSWDAMHRTLSDGHLKIDGGTYPLNHAVLGGEPLYGGADYAMSLKTPAQVRDIAAALEQLTRAQFRKRYASIDKKTYRGEPGTEDFAYTWEWFQNVRDLYLRAAAKRRFVLFTVDQPDISLPATGNAAKQGSAETRAKPIARRTKYKRLVWHRIGGSWLDCSVPLCDFTSLIAAKLPAEYGPYVVVGEDVVPESDVALDVAPELDEELEKARARLRELFGERKPRPNRQRFRKRLFCYPIHEIERAIEERPGRDRVYIGSLRLSPWLQQPSTPDDGTCLILSGLTLLDLGRPRKTDWCICSLTAVERVEHSETGEVVAHEEYSRVYRIIRKAAAAASRRKKPVAA